MRDTFKANLEEATATEAKQLAAHEKLMEAAPFSEGGGHRMYVFLRVMRATAIDMLAATRTSRCQLVPLGAHAAQTRDLSRIERDVLAHLAKRACACEEREFTDRAWPRGVTCILRG